jgi:hypothetical protein
VPTANDDDQTTAAVDDDKTASVTESPPTIAAEQHSEPPTAIVPDVRAAAASELAWSSEAETGEITDGPHWWGARLLWIPLVALLCASVAVVVWFSMTLYRQHEPAVPASPSPARRPPAPAAAPPVIAAPPQPITQTPSPGASPTSPKPSAPTVDSMFLDWLHARNIGFNDPQHATSGGRWVCAELADGRTRDQILDGLFAENHSMSPIGVVDLYRGAVAFYCPQYEDHGA